MNVRFSLLFVCPLLVASVAHANDWSGIYVNKKYPCYRIELLDNGRYYTNNSSQEGTYSIDGKTCTCRRDGEEEYRFQRQNDTLVDEEKNVWVPHETLAKLPWKDVSPVTVVVLDRKTRKPITQYSYDYSISTPKAEYDTYWVRPKKINSPKGEFTVLAPPSCKIGVSIEGDSIVGGFGQGGGSYSVTSKNKKRRIEVLVNTGITIEGVVVDAKTGKPIKDAVVSPIIFCPPLFTADRNRQVKTDAEGKFTISGVQYDFGISVSHPDYFEFNHNGFDKVGDKISGKHYSAKIKLHSGDRIFGTVRDPDGKPLSGVKVSDGSGKRVQTDREGRFTIDSPRKWWNGGKTYYFSFEKKGYLDKNIHPESTDPQGFSIVLEPRPTLLGQVLGPDGRPIEKYLVAAAIGLEPAGYRCWDSKDEIDNAQGRFLLRVDTGNDWNKVGKVWVGVKSPNFALWETTIEVWKGKTSITAHLKPGVTVSGTIADRKKYKKAITVMLLPCRTQKKQMVNPDELSQRQVMGRLRTKVGADGTFQFDHVAPGSYHLSITGSNISPVSTSIHVADKSLDAGQFQPVGMGRIEGIVYEPKMVCEDGVCRMESSRQPWRFVQGHITLQNYTGRGRPEIPFKTDENGRFRIDQVPVGLVSLGINYHQTADIIGTYSRWANVVEEKTTHVRFFDPSGDWNASCKPVVGDGSAAQFATGTGMAAKRKVQNVTTRAPMLDVMLTPLEKSPVSYIASNDWDELENNQSIMMTDVQPGKYHLSISDWQGSRGLHGVVYEKDVETTKGGTTLTCPLGPGSITGGIKWSKPYQLMIHVMAVGKKTGTVRHSYCDQSGNFCVRYLPADDYQLYAHDHDAGWCKLPDTRVDADTTDIGEHALKPGGSIVATLPARYTCDESVVATAVNPQGLVIEIESVFDRGPIGKTARFNNLWPDQWTIRLTKDNKVVAEKTVDLKTNKTTTCTLTEP